MTVTSPWVVVGLGNPGAKYRGTRHNIGQMVVDHAVSASGERLRAQRRARCDVADTRLAGERIVWAVPHSYMNESGGPVSALLSYYSGSPERLVVIHDEIDLPFSVMRVKHGGGDNGHNGLKSIRRSLATGDWYRVRVGVGRGRAEAADHVLAGFSAAERTLLPELVERAAACTERLVADGLAAAQNEFNG